MPAKSVSTTCSTPSMEAAPPKSSGQKMWVKSKPLFIQLLHESLTLGYNILSLTATDDQVPGGNI